MAIKIKHKDPKSTDFGVDDIVINVKEGTIFYKSEKGLFKLQGDNLNTDIDLIKFDANISASKGFFNTSGLGEMKIGVEGIKKFTVGSFPTLEVGGHILPTTTSSPKFDLGSVTNPWKKLYISPTSIHFIKTRAGVGASKIGTTFIIGRYKKETIPEEEETFTQENVINLKAGRTISSVSRKVKAAGNIESADGIINYIRPEVIYHPTEDESALIHKTAHRLSFRTAGGDPLDIFCDGESNDKIRLGSTTTNATEIKLHGSISASIDGGSW